MALEGYTDYKHREFCKDVKCTVQMELDTLKNGSEEYEKIRTTCKEGCIHTTYAFHHWLIEQGFLVVRKEKN